MKVCSRSIKFSELTNRYIYVLFGFLTHLYILFSSSLYLVFQNEIQPHLGITKETLINYFAFFSIILLLISLSLKWTWPIKVEEALIIIFIWILLRNLMPKDCLCCTTPAPVSTMQTQENTGAPLSDASYTTLSKKQPKQETPGPLRLEQEIEEQVPPRAQEDEETDTKKKRTTFETQQTPEEAEEENCPFDHFTTLYSLLCLVVMISSFLMNARNYLVSLFFTVTAIILMIFTTLLPVTCNQFSQADINANLLKFTLYSAVWFINRRMRLTEQALGEQYLKSITILCSYDAKLSLRGDAACTSTTASLDPIVLNESDELVPYRLFERLNCLATKVKPRACKNKKNESLFGKQLENFKYIYRIHSEHTTKRWSGYFFSWKYRFYDNDIQNVFDLTKTLWILNVCPLFLIFIFIEYFLILYHIRWNILELRNLIKVVKLMTRLYKQDDRLSVKL